MIDYFLSNADPANLVLVALMWWRLDRRLRRLAQRQEELHGGTAADEN